MKIVKIRARTLWNASTREECVDEFRMLLEGLESEAMAAEMELDYRTLELSVEEEFFDMMTIDGGEESYVARTAEAVVSGVMTGE